MNSWYMRGQRSAINSEDDLVFLEIMSHKICPRLHNIHAGLPASIHQYRRVLTCVVHCIRPQPSAVASLAETFRIWRETNQSIQNESSLNSKVFVKETNNSSHPRTNYPVLQRRKEAIDGWDTKRSVHHASPWTRIASYSSSLRLATRLQVVS